jgi:phosphinothricin acetyltransferase
VIAVIDEQNEASIAFHERNGFKYVGMIHRAGYKFGQYRNAQFYQFSAAQMSAL